MNRLSLLVLHVLSLVLLGFGWFTNMLHIEVNAHFIFDLNLFNEDRSVIGTLQTLWKTGNFWPFLLIFFFGIVIPLVKSAVIFYLLWAKKPQPGWYGFVNAISKWAMADVFAVGIFVAFLGASAMQNTGAALEPGFYYFSAYVILGNVISMLLGKLLKKAAPTNA
ncbi:MAG: paraquat-inducible protein A [Bacteroidetes bacterium]|nr:paraquat-inducible protein A [Bacteroidota bacterium]